MFGGLLKSTSRLALVAAAATAVGGVAAQAADLGGNCCADLEERVADLEATTARKGNRKVSLTVSGVIDKAIVWHDGEFANSFRNNQLTVRDGDQTGTRVRFVGSARVNADVTFGYNLELALSEDFGTGTNVSSSFPNNFGYAGVTIRQSHFFATSKTFGSLAVGQLSTATDGIYQINLSNAKTCVGCDLNASSSANTIGGRVGAVFALDDVLDGGRLQGVRYTTPSFAGFTLQTGWYHSDQDWASTSATGASNLNDTQEQWDVALRYAGEFSGFRLAAGVGYREVNVISQNSIITDRDQQVWSGSGSIMHVASGIFLNGGYGKAEIGRNSSDTVAAGAFDRTGYWGMLGIEQNWFGIGKTTLFGEYIVAEYGREFSTTCDNSSTVASGASAPTCQKDGTAWGLGVTQAIDAAATNIYLSYRNYQSDAFVNNRNQIQDVQAFVGGVQINF